MSGVLSRAARMAYRWPRMVSCHPGRAGRSLGRALPCALAAVLLGVCSAGAQDVGTFAVVSGAAEVCGGGVGCVPAEVGMAVQLGDELRTGDNGQLRVVFNDDSIIDLTERSALVVDTLVFDPDTTPSRSLVRLVRGALRALVGHVYGTPGSVYEVETPTAVAGVRGTQFLATYFPNEDATEVVGVVGQVSVRSLAAHVRGSVHVTAQEVTTVARDGPPAPPRLMDEQLFRERIRRFDVLALGHLGQSPAVRALGSGKDIAPSERAGSVAGTGDSPVQAELRNAGDVAGQPLSAVQSKRGSLGVPF